VLKQFPQSPGNDETLLYLGQAYMLSGEKNKGKETFSRLSREFSSSRYLEDARKFMESNY
jgi:outer membrane protein assembly factor BamD